MTRKQLTWAGLLGLMLWLIVLNIIIYTVEWVA
jgi:hypothetical protein